MDRNIGPSIAADLVYAMDRFGPAAVCAKMAEISGEIADGAAVERQNTDLAKRWVKAQAVLRAAASELGALGLGNVT